MRKLFWKYSSYGTIILDQPPHIARDTVLEWFGSKNEYILQHNEMISDAQSRWFTDDDFG